METLLPIGRFALASGLTVKALRHYDEIGLLRPVRVDASSGYRFYGPEQLRDAEAIRRLRRFDVPLEEIRLLLGADGARIRACLAEHRARLAASAEDTRRLLAELDWFITSEEDLVPDEELEIVIRDVPELRLAAVMRQLHGDQVHEEIPRMIHAVGSWLDERGVTSVGPPLGVFRSGDRENWHLAEVGWPVPVGIAGDELIGVHVYPASRAATFDHHGPYEALDSAAQRFIAAVTVRGLTYTQPIRVEYIRAPRRNPPQAQHARIVWPVE